MMCMLSMSGGANGQLVHHKHAWFSQKDVELFKGAGTPVSSIVWRGNVVAWADASQVRLMDISTETAICFLNRYKYCHLSIIIIADSLITHSYNCQSARSWS